MLGRTLGLVRLPARASAAERRLAAAPGAGGTRGAAAGSELQRGWLRRGAAAAAAGQRLRLSRPKKPSLAGVRGLQALRRGIGDDKKRSPADLAAEPRPSLERGRCGYLLLIKLANAAVNKRGRGRDRDSERTRRPGALGQGVDLALRIACVRSRR